MATAKKRKVAKYKRPLNINIGMIIFGIILVYIVISIILYIRSDKVSVYEVKEGSLAVDNQYTGFIIRQEEIGYAEYPGYINYYAREMEKVGTSSIIYTIDESGEIANMLIENAYGESSLSEDELKEIEGDISSFKNNFQDIDYSAVYDFKYSLEGRVLQLVNMNILSNIDSLENNSGANTFFNMVTSPKSGVLSYYTDGYEATTLETFTPDMLNHSEYKKTSFSSNSLVGVGDPVYKMVTSEDWSVVIELSEERAAKLSENEYIEVEFMRDNTTAWAKFSTFRKDEKIYGKLDFNNSMIRYVSERYLQVKLLTDEASGLKLPVSSIVEKDFYSIPITYFTKGGNDNETGVIMETYDENGAATTQFLPATIYNSDEEFNYVDTNDFKMGDYIIKPDSTERYQIGATKSFTGVYNINKGYAVFKLIHILYQNNEYCIVEKNTKYGLSIFDYIVLDSSAVKENDIILQ